MQYTFLSVSLLRATKHGRKIIFVSSVLATEKEDVLFNTSHQKGKLVDLSSYDLLQNAQQKYEFSIFGGSPLSAFLLAGPGNRICNLHVTLGAVHKL